MNVERYRVIAIGDQSPEMLSEITQQLSTLNYEIETISSLRLGHSFVVVLMIEAIQGKQSIENCLRKTVEKYELKITIDKCTREKFEFVKSDAFMRIRGSHVTGVKSYIISEFTDAGLDIHGLESDTLIKNDENHFIINIKGLARDGLESLTPVADKLRQQDLEVTLASDWTLLA